MRRGGGGKGGSGGGSGSNGGGSGGGMPSGNGVDRETIIQRLSEAVGPEVNNILDLAPDAQVGFRGSLAKGVKGPHKGNAPFNPDDFDVDAFIVSDALAANFPLKRSRFRAGGLIDGIGEIQDRILESLRQTSGFEGLRNEPFTFRIFTQVEINRLLEKGDVQIFILPIK